MRIKAILKKTFLYPIWLHEKEKYKKRKEEKIVLDNWNNIGRPVPPPQVFKRRVIKDYAKKFDIRTLLETGTYLGDTVEDCRELFEKIYSIELDKKLHANAIQKFGPFPHISLVQGDSGQKIGEILAVLNEPCLFWLDGHYSEGITAKGNLNTPIIAELDHIFNHKISSHVILIDDARCFIGADDYPSVNELQKFVLGKKPNVKFYIADDIIRIHN